MRLIVAILIVCVLVSCSPSGGITSGAPDINTDNAYAGRTLEEKQTFCTDFTMDVFSGIYRILSTEIPLDPETNSPADNHYTNHDGTVSMDFTMTDKLYISCLFNEARIGGYTLWGTYRIDGMGADRDPMEYSLIARDSGGNVFSISFEGTYESGTGRITGAYVVNDFDLSV